MRVRSIRQRVEDSSYDLNLAPMLDMMVALVPFLLISIAFVKLVVSETQVPQPVAEAIQQDKDKKDRNVQLRMYVDKKKIKVVVTDNGKNKSKSFSATQKNSTALVHKYLVELKQKYPETFRLELFPKQNVSYKNLVALMDAARSTLNEDPQLYIMDKKLNKRVPTKLMFPDVVFGNIVGG